MGSEVKCNLVKWESTFSASFTSQTVVQPQVEVAQQSGSMRLLLCTFKMAVQCSVVCTLSSTDVM